MRTSLISISLAGLLLAASPMAFAHAILVRSTPADQAMVHSRNVDIALDYNSRIEASRCTLALTGPSGQKVPVHMEPSTSPSELKAEVENLTNGKYHIHWQALASDGHITRGDIAFTVSLK